MTEQEQHLFKNNLEAALSWMQTVHDKLKTNDNTQGPRSTLEARLRETEKILESQHEGRVKMDMVLVGAEVLLQKGDEGMNQDVQTKLKDLKGQWEDTSTYIIHCHSRIEWVWLHWSEYLKAHQEFELWLTRLQRSLDTGLEQQVGAREKLWQVEHQRVVVSDIRSQGVLLERLLDESATLHNRTQDPSVDSHAQKKLQESYNNIRDRAEERLVLLRKIAEEHQMYHSCVSKFKLWLQLKVDELNSLVEIENTAEDLLKALQTLKESVSSEQKTLQHIESMTDAMRVNTSPAGAELLIKETNDLRLEWQKLWQRLSVSGEGFRSNLDNNSLYFTKCQFLAESISHFKSLFQRLRQELDESEEASDRGDGTEDPMVDRWKKYVGVRESLSVQEPEVEHLKGQLKELLRFSHDSRHLSDEVLAVVKEHQSVKVRALKLCSDAENVLRQVLQQPLHSFTQWSQLVCQVLDESTDVLDSSHIDMQVQRIEKLIKQGAPLEERLSLLHAKTDLLGSVFGPERTESLLSDLSAAITSRELLHNQLVQRRSILQDLIARLKDFGAAYESLRNKLMGQKTKLSATDCLQPDILAKKSQCEQLRMIMRDLQDYEIHILAMENVGPLSSDNETKFEMLHRDWQLLYKTVKRKVIESEESVKEHESFHENLLTIETWLMTMKQRLESYCSPSGEWSIENRQHEAENALGEFPEKELQLHITEDQGNGVLERTSKEGRAHILGVMKHLRESWVSLHDLGLNIYRLLTNDDSSEHLNSDQWVDGRSRSVENLSPAKMLIEEAESQYSDSIMHGERCPKGYSAESYASLDSKKLEVEERKLKEGLIEMDANSEKESGALTLLLGASPIQPSYQNTVVLSAEDYENRRQDFEAWLRSQNKLFAEILHTKKNIVTKDLKFRQNTIETLKNGVTWGQEKFELLIKEGKCPKFSSGPHLEDVNLEELRYRWMLYKSKLKDMEDLNDSERVHDVRQRPAKTTLNEEKKAGLLYRVCSLAVPFQILFLVLLLLAFLLPFMDTGVSCSLSNNFARSFNVMLRYNGPPPT